MSVNKKGNIQIKNRVRLVLVSIFFLIYLVLLSCGKQRSEWQGTIERENNIIIVRNPIKPMYEEEAFRLAEELSVGRSKGTEGYIFSQISDLVVDKNNNIYVLDSTEAHIKVFNRNGKYLRTISGKGHGPGEIGVPRSLSLTSQNEIMVSDMSNRRLSFFSREGDFIKSISTARMNLRSTDIDSEGNLIGVIAFINEDNLWHELKKFDSNMNYLFSFASAPAPSPNHFNPFMPVLRWSLTQNDWVVCAYPEKYEIDIFDSNGTVIRKIMKSYNPIKISREEKERLEELPETINVVQRKYKSAFQRIIIGDAGHIFIQTWEKVTDKDGYYYDVFDPQGKYIVKVPLMTIPQILKNNKIYTIEEDKEGYQYIRRYQIIWKY